MSRILAILLGAMVISTPAHTEELRWSLLPVLGDSRAEEGNPTDTIVYKAHKLLENQLPQYKHSYIASVPNRAVLQLSRNERTCTTISTRAQARDKVGYFIPFLPSPPIQIIIRSDRESPPSIKNSKISLGDILREGTMSGVIAGGRGYPNELEALIDKGLKDNKITQMASNTWSNNMLEMVRVGRADYTFEYFVTVQRYNQARTRPLTSISISENTNLSPAGIYCPRSDWGRIASINIDKAIRELASEPVLLLPIYRETIDEQSFEGIKEKLLIYFQKRSRAPTVMN